MKLLLDENLSRRIVPALSSAYPGSTHVVLEGLQQASDEAVWQYAKEQGLVVVSKDDDFSALSALRGHPPRLIRLALGNCSNEQVARALLDQRAAVEHAFTDPAVALIELLARSDEPSNAGG